MFDTTKEKSQKDYFQRRKKTMSIQDEIKKRRTFAIISHPDAGKQQSLNNCFTLGVKSVKLVP